MRVATWNVNNIRHRLPLLIACLDATKPDVVALQELKTTASEFPYADLEAAGYGSLVVGLKSENGVVLLARRSEPSEIRRALADDARDVQARYVEAAINGVMVGCLYALNGNPYPGPKFERTLTLMERLVAHAYELLIAGHPVVLAGDLKVVLADFDSFSTKSCADNALLRAKPRAAYERLLKKGWTDAFQNQHPSEPMYMFWEHRRNLWPRDARLRIDHLLHSKPLKPRLFSSGVDRAFCGMDEWSDYVPAWAELL